MTSIFFYIRRLLPECQIKRDCPPPEFLHVERVAQLFHRCAINDHEAWTVGSKNEVHSLQPNAERQKNVNKSNLSTMTTLGTPKKWPLYIGGYFVRGFAMNIAMLFGLAGFRLAVVVRWLLFRDGCLHKFDCKSK
jgi:hypothetical protein